jgi:hypothetical protein
VGHETWGIYSNVTLLNLCIGSDAFELYESQSIDNKVGLFDALWICKREEISTNLEAHFVVNE